MKTIPFLLKLLILLYALPLFAQSEESTYLRIDYLTIDAEEMGDFNGQVRTSWKKHQENRIEEEEIIRWQLYKVLFPGSHNHDYNYVSITVANSLNAFETDSHSDQEDESGNERQSWSLLNLERNIRHSELWTVRNSVLQSDREYRTPSRYLMIDYMEVALGREFEYQMFEDEVAKPLHEERMKLDRMDAWELYELITPGGMNYGYNFATGNYFQNLEHIEFGFTEELIRQTHEETNIMEFFQTIFATRDLVQSEVWEIIDYTE